MVLGSGIRDPEKTYSGSRIQGSKSTRSRIRIRNIRPMRALISTHFIHHTDIYLKKFIYARTGMYINDSSLFRRHQKTSHSACARFKCPLCAKRFKDECRLKQHHLDHADQTKKFICSYCSKAWNRPSDLGNRYRRCSFVCLFFMDADPGVLKSFI
jgi:hypothetical protein